MGRFREWVSKFVRDVEEAVVLQVGRFTVVCTRCGYEWWVKNNAENAECPRCELPVDAFYLETMQLMNRTHATLPPKYVGRPALAFGRAGPVPLPRLQLKVGYEHDCVAWRLLEYGVPVREGSIPHGIGSLGAAWDRGLDAAADVLGVSRADITATHGGRIYVA